VTSLIFTRALLLQNCFIKAMANSTERIPIKKGIKNPSILLVLLGVEGFGEGSVFRVSAGVEWVVGFEEGDTIGSVTTDGVAEATAEVVVLGTVGEECWAAGGELEPEGRL